MTNTSMPFPIYAELSAGAVIYKKKNSEISVAIIHRKKMNDYSLPKGHQTLGESLQKTLDREILEETGWTIEVEDFIKQMTYKVVNNDKKIEYWRNVYWFLARGLKETASFADPNEVDSLEWLPVDKAINKLTHENEKEVLVMAVDKLTGRNLPNA